MELHYSQTVLSKIANLFMFYYLMELHYSQTVLLCFHALHAFYYLMELHYSQTRRWRKSTRR